MLCTLALWLALQIPTPGDNLAGLVAGVERLFAGMKDFSAQFVQIFQDPLNRRSQESGQLFLMRPRMMRWEYQKPDEKLFVSDGKFVYLYVPAEKQAQREALRETMDDRIPLMFLVGRAELRKEFTRIELLRSDPVVPGARVLRMFPRRKTDLTEVVLEVDPKNYHLRRLAMTRDDGSRTEFIFSSIRINSGLKAQLFQFKVPPGVVLQEGVGY